MKLFSLSDEYRKKGFNVKKIKKLYYIAIALAVIIAVVIIYLINKDYELCIGEYDFIRQDGEYITMSYLQINEDKTFVYCIDNAGSASEFRPEGVYVIEGNKLILLSDESEFQFEIGNKKLILEKGSEISDEHIGNGAEYIFGMIDWGY